MSDPGRAVFLFDCDNTLLDNDAVSRDLRDHLTAAFGAAAAARYWEIFEQLRSELGYADYLGALQRYRQQDTSDTRLLLMSSFLIDYPFADRLYPDALAVIAACALHGEVVILSDGDAVFQPRKIVQSGLWEAVHGQVLIYVHKEAMLAQVMARYPARRYIMVDDKVRVLSAMKSAWGERLVTVFPRQGHYALDDAAVAKYPAPDVRIDRIGDLLHHDLAALAAGG